MSDKHIVIIGHGIAARCVIFQLNKRGFDNITVVASDAHAPMCSTRTTAINCLRGTKPGKSDLGDLILKSYKDFEEFYVEHKPLGINKTNEIHCIPVNSKKLNNWNRRYLSYETGNEFFCFNKKLKDEFFFVDNEAYIFDPEIFYKWLKEKSSYSIVESVVTNVEMNSIELSNNKNIKFDELIICTSYMSKDFSRLVMDEPLKHQLMHSKPVPGSYLKFHIELFNSSELDLTKSYCYRIEEIHLIVRPNSKDVLIGATSTNNSMDDSGDAEGMLDQYKRLQKYLEGVVTLPEHSLGELITGIRHKGQNRRPFWGKINSNIYAAWGLYKNAFTFSFKSAKDLSDLVQE